MNQYLRQLPVALFGLVAVHWWPWAVYELQQLINLLAGSPGKPAQDYAWLAVLGAPFVVGLASGVIIYLLRARRPVRSLIVFWVFLIVGFVIFCFHNWHGLGALFFYHAWNLGVRFRLSDSPAFGKVQ